MKSKKSSRIYIWLALGSVLLLLINLYVVKVFVIFGSPILFILGILVTLICISVFIYSLLRILFLTENIVKSLAKSVIYGLARNEYIKKLITLKNPLMKWLIRRFDKNSAFGIQLTITLFIAAFFLVNFIGVLLTIKTSSMMSRIDTRILNQIPNIRTPLQDSFFRIITMLANTQSAILLIIAASVYLWRNNQKILVGLLIFVAAGEESVTYIIKHIVHRLRPERMLSLFGEDSFSFPSGHAVRATVLFGFIAYVMYKSYASLRVRLTTLILYVLSIFLVALSRVYLGVHYPSDVWSGVLLGSAELAIVIGLIEIAGRYKLFGKHKINANNKSIVIVPSLVIIFSLISAPFFIRFMPSLTTPAFVTTPQIDAINVQKLPLYSETLSGARMEPISFIYYGYEDQITQLYKSHSWEKADPSTLGNTLRAVAVGFKGGQYITAPVTPSFLNAQPENLAFEKSTEKHSLSQRHHTRLWRTSYALVDGRPIWVATASFDDGIKFAGSAKLPTHHIDPNIDAERSFITHSLGEKEQLIQVVKPQLGINGGGDGFFTDGKAQVIMLSKKTEVISKTLEL